MAPHNSPKEAEIQVCQSAEKVIVTVFWDEKDIIPVNFLLRGQK
jgi:hypothetical protein